MKEYRLSDLFNKPISGEWGSDPKSERDKTVGVLRSTNFSNDIRFKLDSNIVRRVIEKDKIDKKKLLLGDIIIEKSGGSPTQPVGRVLYYDLQDEDNLCNNFTSILRPKENVKPKYLAFLLQILYERGQVLKYQNKTTGIINLQLNKYLTNTKVQLPPFQIQENIVNILDKAQKLIDYRKEQISYLDKLIQSIFYEMFGDPVTNPMNWKVEHLSNFGEWRSGGTPSRSITDYYKGDIPWVSSGELNEMYIQDTVEHITEKAIAESATKTILPGSLLLGMYDTAALKSSITKSTMTCNQAIAFSKLDDSICNTKFVYWYIQIGKDHFRRMQRGVRQKNLNLSMIKMIPVFHSPLSLQNSFVDKTSEIEVQRKAMISSLKRMQENFSCLKQKAFKGELT